jgi:hypothetical protein
MAGVPSRAASSGSSAPLRLLAVLLLLLAGPASSRTSVVGPEITFLKLRASAVCGPAVAGHTLLCFDPAVPVPIGFGAMLRVTQSNFTVAMGANTVTVTAAGAVAVNGAAAGPPGSLTIAGAASGRIDGVWLVRRETQLAPVGVVQDVCVVGTTVCGLRMILDASEPSIAVVDGSKIVIDDNITLPIVMAALASDTTHIVSRWNIFSAQQHAQLVLPVDVPVDGTTELTLRYFTGGSQCGNAYYRHEQRVSVPMIECAVASSLLRDVLRLDSDELALRFDGCPALGTNATAYDTFRDTACAEPARVNVALPLGVCNGTAVFECRSAL